MINDITFIEQKIVEFINKNTHSEVQKIVPQTMLFKEGIFDSMAFVLLIDYLEQTFEIKLGDEDLIEDNFESIDAITNYIHRKMEVTVT